MSRAILAAVVVALISGTCSVEAAAPDVPSCSPSATRSHSTLRQGAYDRYCGPGRLVARVGDRTFVIRGGSCVLGNGRVAFGVIGHGYPGRGVWLRLEVGWTPRQSGRIPIIDGIVQLPGFASLPHTGTAIIAKDLESATFTLCGPAPLVTGTWTCGAARRSP